MNLHQVLSILRARIVLAALILLSVLAVALAWVLLRPAHYVARAAVLVGQPGGAAGSTPVSPGYLSTQIDIVGSARVAQRAIELLPTSQEPMASLREEASSKPFPQQWLMQALQRGLDVKPARESDVISIAWTGRSPAEAALVANAFAQAYLDTNLDLRTAPARRDSQWLDQQLAQLRQRVETANAKLAAYQQQAGIVSTGEQGDYERQRLAELSAELAAAETREHGGAGADPVSSPVVDTLRGDVARLEAKIQEASATLGPNHPKMQEMQAELGAMRSRLASESARTGRVTAGSGQVRAGRIRELRQQIDAQKARVLSMGRQRGELSVLQHDAEAAQKDYDALAARAAQSRLQGASTQGNAILLAAASEPLEPSGLRARLALLAAFCGGLLLAVAGALLAEFANRRVRCVEDLEAVAGVPILGVVPAPSSRIGLPGPASARRRLAFHLQRSVA